MDSTGRYQSLLQQRASLEEERNGIISQYEALLDAADAELTDEQRTKADEYTRQIQARNDRLDQLQSDIDREEQAREFRRQRAASRKPQQEPVSITGLRDRGEDDPMWGFQSYAEFGVAVMRASRPGGAIDDRLSRFAAPANYHQETGSSEGYLVPPQMRDEIWSLTFAADGSEIIDRVNWEPTSSTEVTLLADESTPWGASGIMAYWRSEAEQMSPTKLDLESRRTRAHGLYALVLATEEILQDAPRLENMMTSGAARALRWKISESVVLGDGVGKPMGWLTSAALVTVAKESNQGNATVLPENVAKMYQRVIGQANAVWLANPDVLPALMTLKLGDTLLWTPPQSGFREAPGGFLLGRPIVFTEHADTLGEANDLMLVNFAGYHGIRRTGTPEAASSIHLYFDYGVSAFRWTIRLGGQPYLSAPVQPNNGSNTRSHFVSLGARKGA